MAGGIQSRPDENVTPELAALLTHVLHLNPVAKPNNQIPY